MTTPTALQPERLVRIRGLVLDVDGVLTDGRLYYGSDGSETKAFHVRDGAAIKQLLRAGLEVAIITGRESPMVRRRAEELGITALRQGADDKLAAFTALRREATAWSTLEPAVCACIGDDLADLPLFEHLGLALTVADAHPFALERADWRANLPGGAGVMREVAELLLAPRGLWHPR